MNINIFGKVIKGEGYGRVLGFPTANLDRRSYSRRRLEIRLGVYAGWALIDGHLLGLPQKVTIRGKRAAGIIIGPLDKTGLPKIEAHLINFKGNLYGKKIILELRKYLRPFKKFKTEEALKKQIKKDLLRIRQGFNQFN